MIQEAKTLLATKPLQTAMARRDVAQLRAAIEVVEGEEDVDGAVVEVSGCGQRTRKPTKTDQVHHRITSPLAAPCTPPYHITTGGTLYHGHPHTYYPGTVPTSAPITLPPHATPTKVTEPTHPRTQEAKVLLKELATEPLRTVMETRSVVGLRTTIPVAVREGLVDMAIVKVSEGGTHIMSSHPGCIIYDLSTSTLLRRGRRAATRRDGYHTSHFTFVGGEAAARSGGDRGMVASHLNSCSLTNHYRRSDTDSHRRHHAATPPRPPLPAHHAYRHFLS